MAKIYRIELESNDLGQLLEGLDIRAEAWEKTAAYHRTGQVPGDELFLVEESSDEYEADAIAEHYRSLIHHPRTARCSEIVSFKRTSCNSAGKRYAWMQVIPLKP